MKGAWNGDFYGGGWRRQGGGVEGERYRDPVVEAYKQHVDRTLLRENLRLTHDQRMRKFLSALRMVTQLRGAARNARAKGS